MCTLDSDIATRLRAITDLQCSYGGSKISGDQNSQTPEPIDQKFGVDDYVGDESLHAKIQNNRPIGGVAAYA